MYEYEDKENKEDKIYVWNKSKNRVQSPSAMSDDDNDNIGMDN